MQSKIIEALDAIQKQQETEFLENAHHEGEQLAASMIADAKRRVSQRVLQYQEDAAFFEVREGARLKNKKTMILNEYKLKKIETLIQDVSENFQSLDVHAYSALIERSIQKQMTDERPRIHVSDALYEHVSSTMGKEYQVIRDSDIEYGFVLSYQHYDVNMELNHLMNYKKEQLIQTAMVTLFGGDDA